MMARDIRNQFGRMMDSAKSGLATGLTNVQTAIHQQTGGASYFYPNTLDLQDSKMSGWLRKQSTGLTARTSWQRRWFTLKGDYMYYYASQDESKPPMGVIFLPGATVVEHSFNPSDVEKFRFEITLPSGGDGGYGGGGGSSAEGHLMSADSEEERRDWIKVINVVLYASVGGAIFGQPLETTLRFEMRKDANRKVPEIVQACVEYLRKYGLKEEGIFRLPGRAALIKQLCCAYDRGQRPVIDSNDMDIHTASSLLKLYLRELPDPLIPASYYETVMRIVTREIPVGETEALTRLGEMLREIPFASYNTLQYICRFLNEVAQYSDVNKMTCLNLATIFVQSFICPEIDDPTSLLGTVATRTQACLVLITQTDRIFQMEYTAHGVPLVIDDILGLNDNSGGGVEGVNCERVSYFSRPCNSDLVGLNLGDWGGGVNSLEYSGDHRSGENVQNSEEVIDNVRYHSLDASGPRLRNKQIDADISLVKTGFQLRQRPSHIDGEACLNVIDGEQKLTDGSGTSGSSAANTDIAGECTSVPPQILRVNNNAVNPQRRLPTVILRPKPGVTSDSHREAFLLAKASTLGPNGRTKDVERGNVEKTLAMSEEITSPPAPPAKGEGDVNGTTTGESAGVEMRPKATPRVAKHIRNSSLQFQTSSSTLAAVKHDLVRSNSTVMSSLLPSSIKTSTSYPVVPPRPKLVGGAEIQSRNNQQSTTVETNRRSCIEFQRGGADSITAGCEEESNNTAELNEVNNAQMRRNNKTNNIQDQDPPGGCSLSVSNQKPSSAEGVTLRNVNCAIPKSLNAVDVSKMSWDDMVSHVTGVCSELEAKQKVIDSVRDILLVALPARGGTEGRGRDQAVPDTTTLARVETGEDQSAVNLVERVQEVVTQLQKYRDNYGELN